MRKQLHGPGTGVEDQGHMPRFSTLPVDLAIAIALKKNMKTAVPGRESNTGHVVACGFLRLWYKYQLRTYSHYVLSAFRVINTSLSDNSTPYYARS